MRIVVERHLGASFNEEMSEHPLTAELVLAAYRHGLFPMADPAENNEIGWYAPDPRAILPLGGLHISKSLARVIRQQKFYVTVDESFTEVVRHCAAPASGRELTWISDEIIDVYSELHELGFAHSVECWHGGQLAGGLYGVSIGGAFFGESMFSRVTDASKVALVHLVERLNAGGFFLLDTQMTTPHLDRLGVVLIPRVDYEQRLAIALEQEPNWLGLDQNI